MILKTKKTFRYIITAIIIAVIASIIAYPKLKGLKNTDQINNNNKNNKSVLTGSKPLYASGYLITPTQMNEQIYSTGSLNADEEVDLAFETAGKVIGIYFTESSRVKKGDLLAKINDKPIQAQLLKQQAQLKLAREREFRQRQLLERDAISRESYDQVATELQTLEADILLTQARISETELRAPFDGIVGLRQVSEGAFATTQTVIARLVKIKPLKVEFSVPERYAGQITPGFPVIFNIDGVQKSFTANVYAVAPKVDIDTRTITVRAYYNNSNEELKPGRYTSVTLLLSQINNTIAIPTQAIIPEMDGEKVFVYVNGKAQQKKVVLGLRTESHVQITKGLNFNDTLLTTAILQLRHGSKVILDTLVVDNTNKNVKK